LCASQFQTTSFKTIHKRQYCRKMSNEQKYSNKMANILHISLAWIPKNAVKAYFKAHMMNLKTAPVAYWVIMWVREGKRWIDECGTAGKFTGDVCVAGKETHSGVFVNKRCSDLYRWIDRDAGVTYNACCDLSRVSGTVRHLQSCDQTQKRWREKGQACIESFVV